MAVVVVDTAAGSVEGVVAVELGEAGSTGAVGDGRKPTVDVGAEPATDVEVAPAVDVDVTVAASFVPVLAPNEVDVSGPSETVSSMVSDRESSRARTVTVPTTRMTALSTPAPTCRRRRWPKTAAFARAMARSCSSVRVGTGPSWSFQGKVFLLPLDAETRPQGGHPPGGVLLHGVQRDPKRPGDLCF
jgi:hypothetical protein